MTPKQKAAIKYQIKQKWQNGLIAEGDYLSLVKQLEAMAAAGASLQEASSALGLYKKKAQAQPKAPAAKAAPKTAPITKQEKLSIMSMLYSKAVSGEITKYASNTLVDKVEELAGKGNTADQVEKMVQDVLSLITKQGMGTDDAIAAVDTANAPKKGMTHEEYIGLWEALKKKLKAGLITHDEYNGLGGKLDKAYQDKKTAGEIEKKIGCDPGTLETDKSIIKLGKELKGIYQQAAKEIQDKISAQMTKYGPELEALEEKLTAGTITADELKSLKLGKLMQAVMDQKNEQLTVSMLHANKQALAMINGEQYHVFASNANWQSYQLTQDTKMNLSFSVYDEDTVRNLVKNKPELIPRKQVNGKKDKAWNQKVIAGAITQAVIQGESIPNLAKRIATDTAETNMKAMLRYARTAMTGAQNAGRMEMLHRGAGMGIKVKKKWLATLDSRTRDSHQRMDGVTVGVDEEFVTPLGSKMQYPGDLAGYGGDVWNCRCTMVYEYEGFPNDPTLDQRISYDEYYTEEPDKKGKLHKIFHRESRLITDMSYDEWSTAKKGSKLNELNAAKLELAEAQKAYVKAKVSETKEYKDIWKDPVTLADYAAKKGAIQGKRDYYDTEIQKYKDAQAAGASWATDEKIKELQKKLKLLNEFEKNGEILEKRNQALANVQGIYNSVGFMQTAAAPDLTAAKKKAKKAEKTAPAAGGVNMSVQSAGGALKNPFSPDAYSKERRDKALWSTDKGYVDGFMRGRTGEVWTKAKSTERMAIYDYTESYSKFNEPLRGIEYGTSRYLGVGNTDLDAGYKRNGKQLNAMTDIIDKCSYDHDMWLQRGVRFGGMDKFFNVDMSLLQRGTQKQLEQALLGTTPTEYGFMSMGSAKGQGFDGDILMNIYAPTGTKMMYAEPFSAYGNGSGKSWDGKEKQRTYGREFETILQQGTQFRVTKVERRGMGTIFVDLEVINQDHQQRWKP